MPSAIPAIDGWVAVLYVMIRAQHPANCPVGTLVIQMPRWDAMKEIAPDGHNTGLCIAGMESNSPEIVETGPFQRDAIAREEKTPPTADGDACRGGKGLGVRESGPSKRGRGQPLHEACSCP